jgi:hypothetical protein
LWDIAVKRKFVLPDVISVYLSDEHLKIRSSLFGEEPNAERSAGNRIVPAGQRPKNLDCKAL